MGESPKFKLVISKLTELLTVQDAVLNRVQAGGYSTDEVFAIRLALDEAVSNAILHGNRQDPSKQVTIQYSVNDQAVWIEVCDQGCGFCPDDLPDPTLDANLDTPSGRGVMLIESYMTEVSFNKAGNCISMVKRKGCKLPNSD